jgi:cysteine desulfurase/selenocysteine lyase
MSTSDPAAGPLDPEILARLASEMFASWPRAGSAGPLPAGPVASIGEPTSAAAPAAGMTPGMATAGSGVTSSAPAHLPGGGADVSALRAPHLAEPLATTRTAHRAPPAPGLGPSGAPSAAVFPGSEPTPLPAATTRPFVDGIDLAAIEVPGDAYLRSLFPESSAGPSLASARPFAGAVPTSHGPTFYFLDQGRPAASSPQVPGFPADPHGLESRALAPTLDVELIRRDFPILEERVNGRRLVWLDNAATTQKPRAVIERLRYFYEHENSNIHRAAHALAARATDAYEDARDKVRGFLNATTKDEIVFVRGGTEAINLVAQAWGRKNIGEGDEIVVTWLEHHANIVPWYRLCEEKGARLRVAPVDDRGQVLLHEYARLLGPKTKLVSLTHVSNALGTVTPAHQMVAMAHAVGALALVDGAQAVSHMPVDVQSLGCDFYAFSGHKVFAPTGIGALYGRKAVLDGMDPWQGGGNMIQDVTFQQISYQGPPARFEAGTPSIGDVTALGMPAIAAYEHGLLEYATRLLETVPGLRLVGTAREKASVLSFVLEGHETLEVGQALDREGIAVRAGHHCAQPILRRFGLESTVRPSLALYNNRADVDALISALMRLVGRKTPSLG